MYGGICKTAGAFQIIFTNSSDANTMVTRPCFQYLGKMLKHHFLLSFTKRSGRKQLLVRVSFIQVITGDEGFTDHLAISCLQRRDGTKRILLKKPVGFILKVDVDCLMPI